MYNLNRGVAGVEKRLLSSHGRLFSTPDAKPGVVVEFRQTATRAGKIDRSRTDRVRTRGQERRLHGWIREEKMRGRVRG